MAWASSFGFSEYQARTKLSWSHYFGLAWLGLAWLTASGQAIHSTTEHQYMAFCQGGSQNNGRHSPQQSQFESPRRSLCLEDAERLEDRNKMTEGHRINTDKQGSEVLRLLYQYKWAMGDWQEEGKALRCQVAVSIQMTKWEQRAVCHINTDRQALRSEVEGRVDEGVYKELQLSARNKEDWVGDGKASRCQVAVSIQTTKWEQKAVGRINTDGQALNSEAEAEGRVDKGV